MGRTENRELQGLYFIAKYQFLLWTVETLKKPQCLYRTAKYLLLYGPYNLSRASVPVQDSYNSTLSMSCTFIRDPQGL